ncbi:LytR/AlgR family response regulator transcription factor [Bacteroidota bacterium]
MKILIIEDEKPAADKIEMFLNRYDTDIEILDKIDSIEKTVNWFRKNPHTADLILMDIQLIDGISFDVFKQVKINTPVIFITAYNEFAIEAFKVNSIDYLLKPISYNDLYNSLEKLRNLKENLPDKKERIQYEQISEILETFKKNYKNRFMIKVGEHIKSITADKIALFYAEGRNVSIITAKAKEYVIDYKLEELENMLDPELFFRVNRTFIVNINYITDVIVYSNSRLKIKFEQEFDKEIIVSREKVNEFKEWFGQD